MIFKRFSLIFTSQKKTELCNICEPGMLKVSEYLFFLKSKNIAFFTQSYEKTIFEFTLSF